MLYECERCGYQSESETEFHTVIAGLPEGFMTWEERWCSKCVAEDDANEVEGGYPGRLQEVRSLAVEC